jgi:hypothetical protein
MKRESHFQPPMLEAASGAIASGAAGAPHSEVSFVDVEVAINGEITVRVSSPAFVKQITPGHLLITGATFVSVQMPGWDGDGPCSDLAIHELSYRDAD